jgi:hypothetical protein
MHDFEHVTIRALSLAIQAGIPTLLVSQPGTAKTEILNVMLRKLCVDYQVSIAALYDPPYFGGYPAPGIYDPTVDTATGQPQDPTQIVSQLPNRWVVRLQKASENGRVGQFLDELTSAPPATRAAALRGVQDGTWGEHRILNLSTVAAMNEADVAESGIDLAAPTANRFFHLPWNPPHDWWLDQMIAGYPPPEGIVTLPKDWKEKFLPQASALIYAYHKRFPGRAEQMPDQAALRSKSWPSFRTWEYTRQLLAAAIAVGERLPKIDPHAPKADGDGDPVVFDSGLIYTFLTGCVGAGVAREFMVYISELDLPDPESLISHPESTTLPDRGDKAYVMLSAVVAAVAANNTEQRWQNAVKVMCKGYPSHPQVAWPVLRSLVQVNNHYRIPPEIDVFKDLMTKAGLIKASP